MQKFIVAFLLSLFLNSCGQLNTDGSSTGGGGGTGGNVNAGRAVIKDGSGNRVAHLVQFSSPTVAFLYIVAANKYAFVNLVTGIYTSGRTPGINNEFAFSETACSGDAAVEDDWAGPMGTVFFVNNRYLEVTGNLISSFNYVSWFDSSSDLCTPSSTGTVNNFFELSEVSRPYNFAAIAPLTITYE